ncbi:MAG: hypothetical protein Kow006_30050 [Gammaproteobacteria bacterium]
MKRDNINYLAVGLFTLVMFGLLLYALFRITGQHVNAERYYAVFSQIPGIRTGTAVTYGGFPIGQVADIEPQRASSGTSYRLALDIRRDWQIPTDSIARIVTPGLLSDKVLNIEEGRSNTSLGPGDQLAGKGEADLFATMNRIATEMESLSREGVRPLLGQLNQQIATLSHTMEARMEELALQAGTLLQNLNSQATLLGGSMENRMARIFSEADTLLGHLTLSSAELNRLLSPDNREKLARMIRDGQRSTENLAQLTTDFHHSRRELEKLLRESNRLVQENRTDLRDVVLGMREALDTVSQHLAAIMHNLESTSRNFSEFSREIRHNPGRLLGGEPLQDAALE